MTTSAERVTLPADAQLFRAAFDRLDGVALIIDPSGLVIAANRAATERFGTALHGSHVNDLADGHSSDLLTDLKIAASGTAVAMRLRAGPGLPQRTSCRVAPLPGRCGAISAYLALFGGVQTINRTFKSLNRELRDAREQQARERSERLDAQVRLQRVESFSSHAAHDLKTPLQQIDMALTFFEEDYGERLPPDGRRLIAQAQDSSRRLQRLIMDLLDRARLAESAQTTGPVQLDALVEAVLQDIDPLLTDAEATVRVAQPLGHVEADAVLARQILANLLSNSVKYRSADRALQIDISTEEDSGDALELIVSDNGTGFDDALAEKVFESFERLAGSDVEGSGLGLANCRMMCQRLGWTIEASGRPDAGARFRLRGLKPLAGPDREALPRWRA